MKQQALVQLRNAIRTSTSSMTSVPKPLKFLRPHYAHLKQTFAKWADSSDIKWDLADILSVLAMTQPQPARPAEAAAADNKEDGTAAEAAAPAAPAKETGTERESLKYKLLSRELLVKSGKKLPAAAPAAASSSTGAAAAAGPEPAGSVGAWGHEYVRSLAGEIGKEYSAREERGESVADLESLVDEILPFFIQHNADFDACDLLIEVEQLGKLASHVTKDNVARINLYILRCSDYTATSEEKTALLELVFDNYLATEQWSDALRLALKLHNSAALASGGVDRIQQVFDHPTVAADPLLAKQLGFMVGAMKIVPEGLKENEEIMVS